MRAERDELTVAEQVLERVSEQLADERASVTPTPGQVTGRTLIVTGFHANHPRKLTPGEKTANQVLAVGRAPVEHGFAHLKYWRILTKLRTDPARAIRLLRAPLVLTDLEVNR
ncbi:hypothetical protein GCM10010360_54180 [Streptomyces nogalater]